MGSNTQLYYGMAQDPLDQLSGGGFNRASGGAGTGKLGRFGVHPMHSEETRCEEVLRQVAEQVAELALSADGERPTENGESSPTRPEWQKLCIQHSVCIHNIYGNCAYAGNCYYHHLEEFKKPDLLFKTEMCRYGSECVNRPRCCFAHSKKERRSPEQNVREALAKNHIHCYNTNGGGGPANANATTGTTPSSATSTATTTTTSSGGTDRGSNDSRSNSPSMGTPPRNTTRSSMEATTAVTLPAFHTLAQGLPQAAQQPSVLPDAHLLLGARQMRGPGTLGGEGF